MDLEWLKDVDWTLVLVGLLIGLALSLIMSR